MKIGIAIAIIALSPSPTATNSINSDAQPNQVSATDEGIRSTWSGRGWGKLRWGMTQEEAATKTRTSTPLECSSESNQTETYCFAYIPNTLEPGFRELELYFSTNRLNRIDLTSDILPSLESAISHYTQMTHRIALEHGPGDCSRASGTPYGFCNWLNDRVASRVEFNCIRKLTTEERQPCIPGAFEVRVIHQDPHVARMSMLEFYKEREAQPEQLTKTPSSEWSTEGWRQLRWGMGPGDVAERVTTSKYRAFEFHPPSTFITVLKEQILQREIQASFSFTNERLSRVELSPLGPNGGDSWRPKDCTDWYLQARSILTSKYGEASCSTQICTWSSGPLQYISNYASGPTCKISILYGESEGDRFHDPTAGEKL